LSSGLNSGFSPDLPCWYGFFMLPYSQYQYMARVILDVPSEKMKSFIQLLSNLGLDQHSITSGFDSAEVKKSMFKKYKPLHNFRQQFLLFDWEFFSNELEFE